MRLQLDKHIKTWQGCQSLKITFPDPENVDVQEIRELFVEDPHIM